MTSLSEVSQTGNYIEYLLINYNGRKYERGYIYTQTHIYICKVGSLAMNQKLT